MTIEFKLSDIEEKSYLKWVRKHNDACKTGGKRKTISFTTTGIGYVIKVACECGKNKDITDVSCW